MSGEISRRAVLQQVSAAGLVIATSMGLDAKEPILIAPEGPASLESPPNIKAQGYRWSIYAFPGGEVERAKDTRRADFASVANVAIASGERIWFPSGDYPLRTAETLGDTKQGIRVDLDVPVDVECALGARLIAGQIFYGGKGAMVFAKAATLPAGYSNRLTRFRWVGGEISTVELTRAYGEGAASGMAMMNLAWYYMPEIRGVMFNGGFTAPAGGTIGSGYCDTCLGTQATVGARIENNSFVGGYDSGVYLSGSRDRRILGADALSTTEGRGVVTVTAPAHGLTPGMYAHFRGAPDFGGIFINGQHIVAGVPTADTFTIRLAAPATASATSGDAKVQLTTQLSDMVEWRMAGSDTIIRGNRFFRCGNATSAKRNELHTKFIENFVYECSTGFAQGDVDEANSYGHWAEVASNKFYRTQGRPISLLGGLGDVVRDNDIADFAKTIVSNGADFTPHASGNRIAAIALHSTSHSKVHDNTVRQTGAYRTGTPEAGKEPCGVILRADPDLDWLLGAQHAHIHDNSFDGVWTPIREYSERSTGLNLIHDNRDQNAGGACVYAATSTVSEPGSRAWTPLLVFGAGDASYDVQSGEYWLDNNVLHFTGYLDVASITEISGAVSIAGLPFSNAQDVPVPVTLVPTYVTLSPGSTTLFGQIGSGSNLITLLETNSATGVLSALRAAAIADTTRVSISGQYRRAVLPVAADKKRARR